MPIVPGSTKAHSQRKGGRVDFQKLLEHTPDHPKGRIQIDPATGLLISPKNNVLYRKKINVKVDGHVIGEKEVPVNGGHVRQEGSVWRIPLSPSRYHWKVMQDSLRYQMYGKMDRTAPVLERAEQQEYQYFRVFLRESALIVEEFKWDDADKAFYSWLKKQDLSKIKLLPIAVSPVLQPIEQQTAA